MPPIGSRPDDRDTWKPSFGPFKKRVTHAMVEAILAREDGELVTAPSPEVTERVTREFEVWIGSAGPTSIFGIGLLLTLVELLPLFFVGVFTRMSSMTLRHRLEYLEALEHTRIGLLATAVVGLKVPLTMLCYEVGDELAFTGFDRPSIAAPREGSLAEAKAKLTVLNPSPRARRA